MIVRAERQSASTPLRMTLGIVGVLIVGGFLSGCAGRGIAEGPRFVVFGDSQFHNEETFERLVEGAEYLQPDFALHVGDMIHGYTYDPRSAERQWDKFQGQLAPLSMDFYPTPGNHDVTTTEVFSAFRETWIPEGNESGLRKQGANIPEAAWEAGDFSYSFKRGNSCFILLDVVSPPNMYSLTQSDLEFLKKQLKSNRRMKNIFISLHDPLYLRGKDHTPPEGSVGWNEVHELLTKYPVRAVFSGHSHIYDYRVRDGIQYFCLNSSGDMHYVNHLAGHGHQFLFGTVDDDRVTFAVATEEGIYPPDAVAPGERNRSSRFMERKKTLLIPNPADGPVDIVVEVPIKNRAKESRDYHVQWETTDYRWSFEPWGSTFTLDAEEVSTLTFHIRGPKGEIARPDLPRLMVESPYTTLSSRESKVTYSYYLFTPPRTEARRLPDGVQINLDGKLREKVWKTVKPIRDWYVDTEGTRAPETTTLRILYDDAFLYVSIVGEEPNPEGMAALAHGAIPFVFGDDDFELYFDPKRDLSDYYRLMVNPNGMKFNSSHRGLFTVDYEVVTHIGASRWSAEFKIPYPSLEMEPPRVGDVWGFNARRHRQQVDPAQRDWSKMNNYPPEPVYFGLLRFL